MTNEHFNLIAGCYDRTASFSGEEKFLRALDLPTDGILLDVGGGTGRVADGLRTHARAVAVSDVSMGMMYYARGKGLDCIDAQAESMPFASGSIDRIIMMDALHHVKSQKDTAVELFRILKPNGIAVIIEPNIQKFDMRLIALAEKLLLMRSNFLTGEKIRELFPEKNASITIEYIDKNTWIIINKNDNQM